MTKKTLAYKMTARRGLNEYTISVFTDGTVCASNQARVSLCLSNFLGLVPGGTASARRQVKEAALAGARQLSTLTRMTWKKV